MKPQALETNSDGSKARRCRPVLNLLMICMASGVMLAQPADHRLVVILAGTGAAVEREVPDIDGDGFADLATCFDTNVVNASTNLIIGTGSECVSFFDLDGQGIKPIATTTFNLREGTLVQRGKLSGQPVLWAPAHNPDVDPSVEAISGSFPAPGTNNILSGTGRFAGRQGRVRLSGAFKDNGDGTSTLNCIFIIDLY
jgi:hypothetical protein